MRSPRLRKGRPKRGEESVTTCIEGRFGEDSIPIKKRQLTFCQDEGQFAGGHPRDQPISSTADQVRVSSSSTLNAWMGRRETRTHMLLSV